MKKLVSVIALVAMFGVHAGAQSFSTISNLVSSLAGTVYSAPVSLNGTYNYGGIAVSATSSEGGVLSNLAGTAVTSGIETKADEYLAKVGIVFQLRRQFLYAQRAGAFPARNLQSRRG